MRLITILTSLFLVTLASALVVPPRFSKRAMDLYVRQIAAEDFMDIEVRYPGLRSKIKEKTKSAIRKVTGGPKVKPPSSFKVNYVEKVHHPVLKNGVPQPQARPPNFQHKPPKDANGGRETAFHEDLPRP